MCLGNVHLGIFILMVQKSCRPAGPSSQMSCWSNAKVVGLGPTDRREFPTLFKMSSAKWRPFCLGLNVLIDVEIIKYMLYAARHLERLHVTWSSLCLQKIGRWHCTWQFGQSYFADQKNFQNGQRDFMRSFVMSMVNDELQKSSACSMYTHQGKVFQNKYFVKFITWDVLNGTVRSLHNMI